MSLKANKRPAVPQLGRGAALALGFHGISFLKNFIGVQLIYSVVFVLGEQQSESGLTCTHCYI